MKAFRIALACAAILPGGQSIAAAAEATAPQAGSLQLPQVSAPIPVTAQSRPFLGAKAAMEAAGYVEEEYFLSGDANVYDWAEKGRSVKVVAGPGHYVTRILVRRPRNPARFGGNVEVTVLNASLGVDFGGPIDFARMVKRSDVWIGITTKAITANALKKFDPARYAPLDWSNPAPAASRCDHPTMIPPYMIGSKEAAEAALKSGPQTSFPATEDGLVWDMLGQLGQLLKSDRRSAILPGFARPYVFMTGVSQSAIYIRTWIAGFHDRYRTADGRPVYDGYLGIVGPAMIRINQCAQDIALDDPVQKLNLRDVPFISMSSEGEMWQARFTRQPDAVTHRGGIVSYEVTGASHMGGEVPGLAPDRLSFPPVADMIKGGMQMPKMTASANAMPPGALPNDFVWLPLQRGAFHNLQVWARNGVKPPLAPRIELDANLEIRRDRYGNALGGLRMPYIDVPRAAHTGYLTAGGMGGVMGSKRPFPPATLAELYPEPGSYTAKFAAATDQMVAGRWISVADGEAMKRAAQAAPPIKPVGP